MASVHTPPCPYLLSVRMICAYLSPESMMATHAVWTEVATPEFGQKAIMNNRFPADESQQDPASAVDCYSSHRQLTSQSTYKENLY